MLYTILGAIMGGFLSYGVIKFQDARRKQEYKNLTVSERNSREIIDIVCGGIFGFATIGLCVGLGAGAGFMYGSGQLAQGVHPFNVLLNMFK